MPGLNEVLAKAGQKMVSEGAAKVAEPFATAVFTGTVAASMGPMLVSIAVKEAVGFIVGPLLMQVFAVANDLSDRVDALEQRVDQLEGRLEDRPLKAQVLLLQKIRLLASVTEQSDREQIQYACSQIGAAALHLEHEMLNVSRLADLSRFRSDLLLGIAASVQPGGVTAARRHLQACLDQIQPHVTKHRTELYQAQDERSRPSPRKTKRVEVTRHFRDMEIGTGRFREVDDGPGHYRHREPHLIQSDIDDLTAVERHLKAMHDGLMR